MAVHAHLHVAGDLLGQNLTPFDGPMTGTAGKLGVHMVGVTEEDEVGKLVDSDPFGFFSLPMQDFERLDSRIVLPDRIVASGRRRAPESRLAPPLDAPA